MKRLLFLTFLMPCLLSWSGFGTTYYVAPAGNDLAAGGISTPWATYTKAGNTAVSNDVVLVQPGIYTVSGDVFQPSNPGVTYQANGAVTNWFKFYLTVPNTTISGFSWYGINLPTSINPIQMDHYASFTVITNCTFGWNGTNDTLRSGGLDMVGYSAENPQGSVIHDCTIINCTFTHLIGTVALDTYGHDQTVQGNLFDTLPESQAMRLFGSNIVVRLNTFTNIYDTGDRGEYTPASSPHPDVIQTFGDNGSTLAACLVDRNYVVGCAAQMLDASFRSNTGASPVTNMAYWGMVFRNNIVVDSVNQFSVEIPNVKFYNNTFRRCTGAGIVFAFYDPATPGWRGWSDGGAVVNNAFVDCVNAYTTAVSPTSYAGPTNLVWNVSDYNYKGFSLETHGLMTGATNLVATNAFPVGMTAPMLGSVLIDAGTNLTSLGVTNDYAGTARPQGSGYDIGALEYDPSLKLHMDFDQTFAAGQVLDTTGNTNTGLRFDATNWITSASGVFGGTAAQFTYVGYMSNDPPHVYPLSQYIAVTNTTGFSYLTNGTISFWAKFATNGDLGMQVMDTSYAPAYSSATASNSWCIGRQSHAYLEMDAYPSASSSPTRIAWWPDDVVQSGGGSPDLSTVAFHLYTATVDCTGNQCVAYYDGSPYVTNAIGLPWLRIYGCASQPWLCVGALAHNGTPQWGDDMYPNSGFFAGKLDDVRIYNRTLAAAEVQSLYLGNGGALMSGGGPIPAAPHQLTIRAATVTVREFRLQ